MNEKDLDQYLKDNLKIKVKNQETIVEKLPNFITGYYSNSWVDSLVVTLELKGEEIDSYSIPLSHINYDNGCTWIDDEEDPIIKSNK